MSSSKGHARKWVSRHITRLLMRKTELKKEMEHLRNTCSNLVEGANAICRFFVRKTAFYKGVMQRLRELLSTLSSIEAQVQKLAVMVGFNAVAA